jgi:hypothetical protein
MKTKRRQRSTFFRKIGIGLRTCAALAIASCDDATAPGDILPGLAIRTGAETIHYVPIGGANRITVPVTVTNHSSKTLNLAYCGEALERLGLRGWTLVYAPVCLANVQTLPPIPVGTSLTFDFYAYDASGPDPSFRFSDSPNVYRVSLSLYVVEDGRVQPLPIAARVTNSFYVEP